MESEPTRLVCKVCVRQYAKYTCPKCNITYCSLSCYKQHSERCTEAFAREQAVTQLKLTTVEDEQKRKMVEILKRLREQEDDEESEDGSEDEPGASVLSAETLERLAEKLARGAELCEDDLPPEERAAFRRAVQHGAAARGLLEPWQPWWTGAEAAKLRLTSTGQAVVAVVPAAHKGDDEAAGGSPASSALPPPPFEPLPQLSSLTKAQPSPLLRWQLLELLYAYALAMRTYNGDCSADVAEAADLCVHIIPGLDPSSGGSGDGGGEPMAATASDAVVRCVARACRPPAGDSAMRALAVALLDDVAAILHNGRSNVVLALWDLKRLMEAARAEATADATATASSSSSSSAGAFAAGDARSRAASLHSPSASARSAASSPSQRSKKVLQAACRKLLFMAAWANEQPEQAFEALASAALDESRKQQQSLAVDSAAASRASVGSGGGGGGKIEQL